MFELQQYQLLDRRLKCQTSEQITYNREQCSDRVDDAFPMAVHSKPG